MNEILKSLGLTPPAITIIVGLGGIVAWFFKQGLKQLSDKNNAFQEKVKADLEEIKQGLLEVRNEDYESISSLNPIIKFGEGFFGDSDNNPHLRKFSSTYFHHKQIHIPKYTTYNLTVNVRYLL